MTEPASVVARNSNPNMPSMNGSAPTERGWGKLFLALAAFILLPKIPQISALLPIEQTMVLFVPALAACALVGWWAGGRAYLAAAWVAIAVLMSVRSGVAGGSVLQSRARVESAPRGVVRNGLPVQHDASALRARARGAGGHAGARIGHEHARSSDHVAGDPYRRRRARASKQRVSGVDRQRDQGESEGLAGPDDESAVDQPVSADHLG